MPLLILLTVNMVTVFPLMGWMILLMLPLLGYLVENLGLLQYGQKSIHIIFGTDCGIQEKHLLHKIFHLKQHPRAEHYNSLGGFGILRLLFLQT